MNLSDKETIKEQIDNGNPVIFMELNVNLPEDLVSWDEFNAGGHAEDYPTE